ncbi:MAG: hypothetical protein L0Z62_25940 [Gemmataceae bacterium]|nr:hypothetical protein [Gemmataceae bacterium]
MIRFLLTLTGLFALTLTFPGAGPGAGGKPEAGQGTIKKVDAAKRALTLTVSGKDRAYELAEDARLLGVPGETLADRLRALAVGSEVVFRSVRRDGKEVIVALKHAGKAKQPAGDPSGLKPLTELGTGEYRGHKGGLYPDGKNERPAAHEAAGRALARQVRPLDGDGKPSADGKIVLLSVGMSNTSQASVGFEKVLAGERDINPRVRFVNGAQGGMTATVIQDPNDGARGTKYWAEVDRRLKAAGVTRAQVQALWIKQADAGPSQGFPGYAKKLQGELARIVQSLPARFPNLQLVYLSSRTYGGYARTGLNPEPYAFESALAVRWLIEQQLKREPALNFDRKEGAVKAPWLSWGPYLWASGATKRADGFSYAESDFAKDGTHLSASGMQKVGRLLLEFFRTDSTARPWFVQATRGN